MDENNENVEVGVNNKPNQEESPLQTEPSSDTRERASWDNKAQFLLSVVGYAVGLGNVWRFPYLCQKYGGGAFMIPFLIMLVLEGAPLFLIELGVGQSLRQGSVGVWHLMHPLAGGVGVASTVISIIVATYYNVIITWCYYYLFNSFQATLPWSKCPKINGTSVPECVLSSETAYFWYREAIDTSESIENTEGLKWWMVCCLILAWISVFLIICRGIQSSGKVVYFTALFPYLVLTIFFGRAMALEGAGYGILHMFKPKVDKLLEPTVWLEAATQVFYSFGLAFGCLIAFGSYNQPKNNCKRDVIFISAVTAFTAVYASAVVFAVLGFKAMTNYNKCQHSNKMLILQTFPDLPYNITSIPDDVYNDYLNNYTSYNNNSMLNVTITDTLRKCDLEEELDQAAGGTGLAFIVFTQAIVELPVAPFWAIIFFLMLLALGLGSQIGLMEGIISNLFDMALFTRIRKEVLSGSVCLLCLIVGLTFVSGSGEYWLTVFDQLGTLGLVLIAFCEIMIVMYVYGHKRFSSDIENMIGEYPSWFWQVTWRFVSPFLLAAMTIATFVYRIYYKPVYDAWDKHTGRTVETEYPDWVLVIASLLVLAGVLPMPVVFLMRKFRCEKTENGRFYRPVLIQNDNPAAENTSQNIEEQELNSVQPVEFGEILTQPD